ncbi:MAG TPA: hypothetical protein VFU38_02680 [Candidatus Krumholzibacteria bacterium]|nr:hypothetical protein [Candidatus Krumholzibacteria bacterium]
MTTVRQQNRPRAGGVERAPTSEAEWAARRQDPRGLRLAAALSLLGALLLGSCLGEPEVDERWTLLEMVSVSPQPNQTRSASQPLNVSVGGRITYRDIVTGFVVAEVRYSPTLTSYSLPLDKDEHSEICAASVDQILANSVTAGRATRAITGWDHLMQDVDLSFTATVPPAVLTSGGLFLVLYLGSGDEIELASGEDSLVVTPFVSSRREILHTGFPITIVP